MALGHRWAGVREVLAFIIGAGLLVNEAHQAVRDPLMLTSGLGLMGYTAIFGRKGKRP